MPNSKKKCLDDIIKDYLWSFTESVWRTGEERNGLIEALRESVGADLAFVLRSKIFGDSFEFTNVAAEESDFIFDGIEFPIDSSQNSQLIKMLDDNSMGSAPLTFLGEEFSGAVLYYAVVTDDEIKDIIGVMDFSGEDRHWSEEDYTFVRRTGMVIGVSEENDRLRDASHYQLNLTEEQLKTEKTQRYLLEDALMKAENANKARRTFLSNMSHDIRTPMNAIIGFAALASTHLKDYDRVEGYLQKITESSKLLLGMFNDILDISRMESGAIQLEESPYSMRDMFQEIRHVLLGSIASKQLEITMDASSIVHEKIFCDRLRINQVILNLMSNAVKYTKPGGHIFLSLMEIPSDRNDYARFRMSLKDDGIGMSPEFVEHIYEPFMREQNSGVNAVQGAGLGMAITKNIVDLMNGNIEVNSRKDCGTEVTIELELRIQAEIYADDSAFYIPVAAGKRFLIVNDSFELCSSIVDMLKRCGIISEWTMSPREAILRAKMAEESGRGYDGFIIGWNAPEMNGLEAARQLRMFTGHEKPIILMGPSDCTEIEADAYEAGISSICAAPYFISDMRASIKRSFNSVESEESTESLVIDDFIGKRILLAEDNKMNQEIAIALLEDSGFFVDLAENGQVAVDKVEQHASGHYDLILMDVQMPIMNGYEATRLIRAMEDSEKCNIPIVAMTADAFFEDRNAAMECGMNEHIAKPVDTERLFAVLKSLLLK